MIDRCVLNHERHQSYHDNHHQSNEQQIVVVHEKTWSEQIQVQEEQQNHAGNDDDFADNHHQRFVGCHVFRLISFSQRAQYLTNLLSNYLTTVDNSFIRLNNPGCKREISQHFIFGEIGDYAIIFQVLNKMKMYV